jgi:multidrug efflux pump subunit AcrA (membrane-fusion protein)
VSAGPNPHIDINLIEQTRRQINRLVEEVARLSEQDLAPTDYYGEFLQRVLAAVAAPAGAVWLRTPQGHLQLQYQVNLRDVGLDRSEEDRQAHGELLRQAAQMARPLMLPPRSGTGAQEEGKPAAGNPTDKVILLAPILVDKQVAGLIEIWQDPERSPDAQRGFLQFLVRMAELASSYTRNHQLRQMVGQQALWTQLEAFARQIHGSLNPMEVAYLVANEGRRLIECDRVSVAQRRGRKTHVEAISGADVVEKRSNLVRLMAKLMDKVLKWGEKLIYKGTKDDTLPPDVLKALDDYLAESASKLLVVLPLKDERESESKRPPRSCLTMECFDPSATPEQLIARLEVVGRHATGALYNASEHRRIPMRFIWGPLAKVQEGLGGKARAIALGVAAALAALVAILVFVPYPLKMDAKGNILPRERRWVFPPVPGQVVKFKVNPGDEVRADDPVVEMRDVELARQMVQLLGDIQAAEQTIKAKDLEYRDAKDTSDRLRITTERSKEEFTRDRKTRELNELVRRTNADKSNPGVFTLNAPLSGTVLNWDFREKRTGAAVRANEQLIRIGNKSDRWEIELRIPQKNIGQVLHAYDVQQTDELDVDLLLLSAPTKTYKGKLARKDIAGEATPNRDDNNESEPVVYASVRIDGDDIPKNGRLPEDLYVTETEVHAKIRCGNHRMGYSLFYGVWEFLYEKVVFFF